MSNIAFLLFGILFNNFVLSQNSQMGQTIKITEDLIYDHSYNTPIHFHQQKGKETPTCDLTFYCDVDCDNQFNGWYLIINQDTIYSGQTVSLPAGTYIIQFYWFNCWIESNFIDLYESVTVECFFTIGIEPDVSFQVTTIQGEVIENAAIIIENDTLYTDSGGKATFCLQGGYHDYTIEKEGYTSITDGFYWYNNCLDTTLFVNMGLVNINEKFQEIFQIYPNPSNYGTITLLLANTNIISYVACFNTLGQLMHQQDISSNKTTISVRNWPPGIYIAVVYEERKAISTAKFVVPDHF